MSESKPRTAGTTDVQKLQRAIVDGLEDVKGQDIVVFNTEHLSPLFERVIIASGTSNRQTKALASSISDAVREAGFPKPRVEGEVNGEWIIVDCGAAVAHVMQPNIRQYYHLEEIWGGKTVHLKPAAAARKTAAAAEAAPVAAKKAAAKAPAKAAATKTAATKTASSKAATDGAAAKPAAKKPAAKKPAAKVAAKTTSKTTSRTTSPTVAKPAVKAAAKTAAAKKTVGQAAGTTATPAKVKTLVVGKPPAKKAAGTRTAAPKAPAARKSPARKSAG
ncbi:MAG: ribosome silencing factor [Polaromonas sp.]|nr:ribosome silencing factor [Polaromonas sp.]